MATPTQPKTAADHLARAEMILARVDQALEQDLAGSAWYAGIATAHLLAAVAIELGAPSGAVHQPGAAAPAGQPPVPPAGTQAGM